MKRLLALLLMLAAGAQIVLAASAPAEKEEMPEDEPEITSAAVAGRFDKRPPTEVGYPVDILLRMRQKLSGEYSLGTDGAEAPAEEPKNGH
ncbi:hypothetical protein [Pseudooceanicola sp. LIPI14-2-Ac024]|uniref:hypothetical protein n=1 Tax=Pseudooceanicola sp. LIPI14-2-Ac024 TaxID=3344875 RepID=UPI0035CEDA1D